MRVRMSPRSAGGVLLVVGVAAGLFCVACLDTGGLLALGAAVGLAVALAMVGLGIVWVRRSGWGPEPVESSSPDHAVALRRTRRSILLLAVFALVSGAVTSALAVVMMSDGASGIDPLRPIGLAAMAIALGILLVVVWARSRPEGPESRDASLAHVDAAPDDENIIDGPWLRLTRRDPLVAWTSALPSVLLAAVMVWQGTVLLLTVGSLGAVGALLAAAFLAVAVAGTVVCVRRAAPEVWVDVEGRRLRIRSRIVDWSAVAAARLSTLTLVPGRPRSLFLTLEAPGGVRVPITLRRRARPALTLRQRAAAIAVVEAANITLPRAPEDPRGKFSRSMFPSHVDAVQARELIAAPPRDDEPLPVTLA